LRKVSIYVELVNFSEAVKEEKQSPGRWNNRSRALTCLWAAQGEIET
jgi:hypothetical protein